MFRFMQHQLRWLTITALLALACAGCDGNDAASNLEPATRPAPPPSPWLKHGESTFVAVPDAPEDHQMIAAIAQARSTAGQAQQRWSQADQTERQRWFIKWAAPTADQAVEHVWVQPINWSPFRIEGTLVSEPVRELMDGKAQGDLVSFPVEELSDWIHLNSPPNGAIDFNAPHEGGFTVKVLQERFGPPRR
jgi:uncharacterized protein YegJ (DUF2314 family)